MISRRNIRIKVLQSLYALLNASEDWSATQGKKHLLKNYTEALNLTLTYIDLTKQVCGYAIIDSSRKTNKHLPTSADLNVDISISNNAIVGYLSENGTFEKAMSTIHLGDKCDLSFIKKLYNVVIDTPEYHNYIAQETKTIEADILIFKFILNIIATNEVSAGVIDDIYMNIEDDNVMVLAFIEKSIAKFDKLDFTKLLSKDKSEFGIDLLETFLDKYSTTADIIKPKLLNWDPERIAMIDMIVMQLGITELLYFESIPTKVSINEYIDISKLYSTMQSGQFVNGVLDNIFKDLTKNNKIHKVDFQKKQKDA
jgi:transcription antitermination protein NusB